MAARQVTRSLDRSRQQQVELLGEQLVVVVEVVAEQRERLGERAAPGHDLGAPAGEQVDGGEVLEHAHGVVRADSTVTALVSRIRAVRAATAASTTAGAETAKSGRWCSPTPNDVEPDLLGELRLLDQLRAAAAARPPHPRRDRCRRRWRSRVPWAPSVPRSAYFE